MPIAPRPIAHCLAKRRQICTREMAMLYARNCLLNCWFKQVRFYMPTVQLPPATPPFRPKLPSCSRSVWMWWLPWLVPAYGVVAAVLRLRCEARRAGATTCGTQPDGLFLTWSSDWRAHRLVTGNEVTFFELPCHSGPAVFRFALIAPCDIILRQNMSQPGEHAFSG